MNEEKGMKHRSIAIPVVKMRKVYLVCTDKSEWRYGNSASFCKAQKNKGITYPFIICQCQGLLRYYSTIKSKL